MPLFDMFCSNCNKKDEVYMSIAEYSETIPCSCGYNMVRVFTPVPGRVKETRAIPKGCVSYEEGVEIAKNAREEQKKRGDITKEDEKVIRSLVNN